MKKNIKVNLDKIFYPDSIAVVGANKVVGTVPYDILRNILDADFNGVVYPVSPRERFIAGIKAYKYVSDIPDPVDLAILVFPSSVTHLALEQCGQKGIKGVIIISAGFKEVGGEGIEREKRVKEIADKYGMSIIGPNCLGVINTDARSKINASFARRMPEEGTIAFLSQSGALCTAVLDYAYAKHIGFSKFISFGNKADVTEIDLLYYLKDDPKTKVILMYLEEITDGPGLMKAARTVIRAGKPILILKAGRTPEGALAAASHTGSMAGNDEICDAAFRQAGIIRCQNVEEMFNIAIAFAYQPMPKSNRIAIITNAGGPGVLATDAAIHEGLELAKFSEETLSMLKKNLPATANIKNPVDIIGDARVDRYNVALTAAFNEPSVDAVFTILTPQSMTEIDLIAREIAKVAHHSEKPIYASFMGEADVSQGIDVLQRNKIPHYFLPESMCRAFAIVYQFSQTRHNVPTTIPTYEDINAPYVEEMITHTISMGKQFLTEDESIRLLKAYGFPVLKTALATTVDEAIQKAEDIGFPVVMKVVSDKIIHKSEAGGVILNLQNKTEVTEAFHTILENVKKFNPTASVKGILIEKMILDGEEVILGLKRDKSFGPILMFGLGGIYVEIFKDVSFRIAPLTEHDAKAMIEETRASAILHGIRGRKPRDVEKIIECLLRLSQLAVNHPSIEEMDINPLIVQPKGMGAYVADVRIILKRE
ncbi:MAG: acetate--CoA ligase family protein [Candidatus Marinimicrobia bacterium]|nr:acetate--CoA ligase family protein [Candidatus Neomarinimicrobiota bacterium]